MKNCTCGKKIRNEYTKCYDCQNEKDSDNDSTHYKKEAIPKTVRNCVWINYFDDSRIGTCICCHREPITINNFHCGHIKAEREGGSTSLDNLAPICVQCNLSMGTMDMNAFIKKYNLHYGLDKSLNAEI